MSKFSKYRPTGYKFKEPERFTLAEISLRRTQAMLAEHERAWKRSLAGLSQANIKNGPSVAKAIVNEPRRQVHKAALIAAALKGFTERDFADPEKRAAYRALRAKQGGQQNVKPSGSDRRQFNPTGKEFAATRYGTIARLNPWVQTAAQAAIGFARPWSVIPCVQRSVRREVMFATGKAGKGYHTPKRRNWASGVPC